jgi:hypothetical protein
LINSSVTTSAVAFTNVFGARRARQPGARLKNRWLPVHADRLTKGADVTHKKPTTSDDIDDLVARIFALKPNDPAKSARMVAKGPKRAEKK